VIYTEEVNDVFVTANVIKNLTSGGRPVKALRDTRLRAPL
jgi:hypothetical protein